MTIVNIITIVGLALLFILITTALTLVLVSDYKRAKSGEKALFWTKLSKNKK